MKKIFSLLLLMIFMSYPISVFADDGPTGLNILPLHKILDTKISLSKDAHDGNEETHTKGDPSPKENPLIPPKKITIQTFGDSADVAQNPDQKKPIIPAIKKRTASASLLLNSKYPGDTPTNADLKLLPAKIYNDNSLAPETTLLAYGFSSSLIGFGLMLLKGRFPPFEFSLSDPIKLLPKVF